MDVLLPTIMAFIIDQGIEKGDMNAVIKYGLLTFSVAGHASPRRAGLQVCCHGIHSTLQATCAMRCMRTSSILVFQHRQVFHGRSGHPHDHRRDQSERSR